MSEYAEAYFDECMALKRELKEQRTAVIEECARVAKAASAIASSNRPINIAAAIRALKDQA